MMKLLDLICGLFILAGLLLLGYTINSFFAENISICNGRGCRHIVLSELVKSESWRFYITVFLYALFSLFLIVSGNLYFRFKTKFADETTPNRKSPPSVSSIINEVDVYLAYGRKKQAEELLRDALKVEKDNLILIKKLNSITKR